MKIYYEKKTLCPLFMDGVQTASWIEQLWGDSLLFTNKFPEISGTHLIELGRMKDWKILKPPSGLDHGFPGSGIERLNQ